MLRPYFGIAPSFSGPLLLYPPKPVNTQTYNSPL
nr:MAG TPA: hypothetical protein [Caudoviricetes sp.]